MCNSNNSNNFKTIIIISSPYNEEKGFLTSSFTTSGNTIMNYKFCDCKACMQYAFSCTDQYYMVLRADTVLCCESPMFDHISNKPFLDYMTVPSSSCSSTINTLLPKCKIDPLISYDVGHMLISTDIMKELISELEENNSIPGKSFTEKLKQISNFNIFDTYGNYVSNRYAYLYKFREWSNFELGGEFFIRDSITNEDLLWLSKDYSSISFKRGQEFNPELAELFSNKYYREKLTPKQILQAILEDYENQSEDDVSNAFAPESPLKYLEKGIYKTYEMLGDELSCQNPNQAYLCYENSIYLCDDENALERLNQKKQRMIDTGCVTLNKTAFIIISFNNKYLTQRCLESIYTNCNPDSYLLIVFDNGSTDGSREWLSSWGTTHDEAIIVLNETNLGFAGGNNAACQYLPDGYDVFYLNNDTRMPANALFWMRMALYSSDDVGGVGAVQNYAKADQLENVYFDTPEHYVEYGAHHNVYEPDPYEEQSKLCGFALLITRQMYEQTGGFDERFNPGFLDDDDISISIRSLGKKLILCQNAFIYHAGSQSFRKRNDVNELFRVNRAKFIDKWGFDSTLYAAMSENEYAFIMGLKNKGYNSDSRFSLVHIGSGCGNMLGHIHYLYPNAILAGVEENDIARQFAISCIPVYKSTGDLPMPLSNYDIVAQNLG